MKKIADLPKKCNSPRHNPPSYISLENGIYEYTCPVCKTKNRFVIQSPFL